MRSTISHPNVGTRGQSYELSEFSGHETSGLACTRGMMLFSVASLAAFSLVRIRKAATKEDMYVHIEAARGAVSFSQVCQF
jgi:hypothetical protein